MNESGEINFQTSLEYLRLLLDWFNGDCVSDEGFKEIETFVEEHGH